MGEEFKDFTTTPTLTFGETPDTQELPSTVAEETEALWQILHLTRTI